MNQKRKIEIIELKKNDNYPRQIGSKYSMPHYYDVSVHRKHGSWRIELTRKAFDDTLSKDYHGKLFEDHVQEPRIFAAVVHD